MKFVASLPLIVLATANLLYAIHYVAALQYWVSGFCAALALTIFLHD